MNVNSELALAAARVRELSERIPEPHRPDIAQAWGELMDELKDMRSDGAKQLVIIEWRADFEAKLAQRLAHAPLEAVEQEPTPR